MKADGMSYALNSRNENVSLYWVKSLTITQIGSLLCKMLPNAAPNGCDLGVHNVK